MGGSHSEKVGIVGLWSSANYGNVLSYYSLYRSIERMGLSPRMIAPPADYPDDVARNHSRKFMVDTYDISPRVPLDRMHELNNWCDTFVVGSGQVWNWGLTQGYRRSLWLDFVHDDKRKLSYAASFGSEQNPIPESEQPVLSQLLHRFDGVSVRDGYAMSICERHFEVQSRSVLDPIFLLDPEHFLELARDRSRRKGHMLAYIENPHPEQRGLITGLSQSLGLEPLALLGGQSPDARAAEAVLSLPSAGPETDIRAYLALVAESEFVVTDSLTAASLCIAIQKPFVVVLDGAHDNSRFQSLADTLRIHDRFVANPSLETVSNVASASIEWQPVKQNLASLERDSHQWLAEQLGIEPVTGQIYPTVEKVVVQNLVFPEGSLEDDWNLCNRGTHMWIDVARERDNWLNGQRFWHLAAGRMIECFTYLNSFSIRKWSTWTTAQEFVLRIRLQGSGSVIPFGHWKDETGIGKEFGSIVTFSCDQPRWVTVPVKAFRADVWGFTIEAMSPVRVFDGHYVAITGSPKNTVALNLITTTFKKEEFLRRNIGELSRVLFGQNEPGRHTFMTIVDNGQTVDPAEFESAHVRVIPNQNSGGAGGFSRGMATALQDERKPTHVLLMDDDVDILPEAIFRTYNLLSILKEEFRHRFVGGAMLELRRKSMQLESLAHLAPDSILTRPEHNFRDLTKWDQVLLNEIDYEFPNQYAGWWYCCIPTTALDDGRVAFPFFVRGDDIDFSLRHAPGFLRLNGVFVWHEAFAPRYSITTEKYQVIRNNLVVGAMHGDISLQKVVSRMRALVKDALIGFSYGEANVILDAVEEYLKGPDFFENLNGMQSIRDHTVEPGVRLSVEEGQRMRQKGADSQLKLTRFQKYLIRVSRNGQRFPIPSHGRSIASVAYQYDTDRAKVYGVKEVVITGVDGETSWLRKRDRAQFRRISRRFAKLTKRLQNEFWEVAETYRAREAELESLSRLNDRLA